MKINNIIPFIIIFTLLFIPNITAQDSTGTINQDATQIEKLCIQYNQMIDDYYGADTPNDSAKYTKIHKFTFPEKFGYYLHTDMKDSILFQSKTAAHLCRTGYQLVYAALTSAAVGGIACLFSKHKNDTFKSWTLWTFCIGFPLDFFNHNVDPIHKTKLIMHKGKWQDPSICGFQDYNNDWFRSTDLAFLRDWGKIQRNRKHANWQAFADKYPERLVPQSSKDIQSAAYRKKAGTDTMLVQQNLQTYTDVEINPDSNDVALNFTNVNLTKIKSVKINKTADNLYQVIVNSTPHKSYKKIVDDKIVVFNDSLSVAYIAKDDDGYCVVVDGFEHPHYEKIYKNRLYFSPDSSRLAYFATEVNVGWTSTKVKTCCVIDGEEQPWYDDFATFGIIFSPDSKHWAYAVLNDKKWSYVIDGVEQPYYELIAEKHINFSRDSQHWAYGAYMNNEWVCVMDGTITQDDTSDLCKDFIKEKKLQEFPDRKFVTTLGVNMKHFGGYKFELEDYDVDVQDYPTKHLDPGPYLGDVQVGGAMGYELYIGFGAVGPESGGGVIEFGFSHYKAPVTFYTASKDVNVNTYFMNIKWYFPVTWKLQPYWSGGYAFSGLNLSDMGEFDYGTVEFIDGNRTINITLQFNADTEYSSSIVHTGLGCKLNISPQVCLKGSVALALNWGSSSKFSISTGGAFPESYKAFNTLYDFGLEITL